MFSDVVFPKPFSQLASLRAISFDELCAVMFIISHKRLCNTSHIINHFLCPMLSCGDVFNVVSDHDGGLSCLVNISHEMKKVLL